jgi:hypothetical protein
MEKNDTIKAIVVVLIAVIIGLVVVVMNNNNEPKVEVKKEVKQEVKLEASKIIQDEFKNSFMEGCFDGTNYVICDCMYEALVKEMGLEKFLEESIYYNKYGVFKNEARIERIVEKCIY